MYDPIATAPGSDTNAARLALRQACSLATTPCLLVSVNAKPAARYNQGRSNKSLDVSGGGVVFKFVGAARGGWVSRRRSTHNLLTNKQSFGFRLPGLPRPVPLSDRRFE